ncbi:MAG: sugar phosphate isomerase/epimerase [Verrucomicrobiota bacterium]
MNSLSRREFVGLTLGGAAVLATHAALPQARAASSAAKPAAFKLRYVLSTNQYGTLPIADIVPEAKSAGYEGLDVWAGRWGNQREQIDALGHDKFSEILKKNGVKVSCYTCMHPGFGKSEPHMRAMLKFGGDQIVAGFAGGGKDSNKLRGAELRAGIQKGLESMKPIIAVAGELGVTLAIENHLNGLLETPDGVRVLAEEIKEKHVGISFAPFHLPQDAELLGKLTDDVAHKILYYYAWQYGDGSGDLAPSKQKRQLPGVGPLDFKPMLAALKKHKFNGYTSIFMHPTPRGSALASDVKGVTTELGKARAFLDKELAAV